MIWWKEAIGILATIVIIISFTKRNEGAIRFINAVGCILFVIYGMLIKSISVWLLNGICFVIQIYYLGKLSKEVSEVSENGSGLDVKTGR